MIVGKSSVAPTLNWRNVLYSGSRLMLDDLDGLSEEEDMLFDPAFPE